MEVTHDPARSGREVHHRRRAGARELLRRSIAQDLPEARARHVPQRQVGGDGGHARHLLSAAVDPLGSRAEPARPGLPARLRQSAAVLRPDRDLGAGILLHHRRAGAVGAGPVSRHRRRRAHVVRLRLPADRVDRSHDRGRALLAGRPQRAHAPRCVAVDAREDLEEGRHARQLAADRARHRRRASSSISAMRRHCGPSC